MMTTQAETGFTEIATEWIPLPDGVRLAARLWLPEDAAARPAPAVLEFLPYRRRDVTAARDESTYPAFARRGIAGVRVDMRGTGDSEGFFDDEYSETELSDAEAVIAWIAAQPWCSGAVGMMGISWGGFNGLQVAARRPAALKAVISIASTVDRYADDIHYKGGCQLSAQLYWSAVMMANIARPPDAAVVGENWRAQWRERLDRIEPLAFDWLAHQRRDAFWRHGSICEDYAALAAPALVIAGWADGYRSTPWKALAGLGAPTKAMTGPWIHKYPHFAFPHPRADFHGEAKRWWDRWLSDAPNGAEDLPDHRLFVEEATRPAPFRERVAGRWATIRDPADDAALRLHLNGDGALAETASAAAERVVRSPLDCGLEGGEYFAGNAGTDLPGDQRHDDGASVCFETAPLAEAVEVVGMPELRLNVAIGAPVGTLVARLVDVHPDGVAHRVAIGVLNLTQRDDPAEPRPMTPGEPVEIGIRLDATAYRFRPGHRIRLALSTHYFPLILPPPTDVAAVIRTGAEAVLDLPTPALDPVEVPAPESELLPSYPAASPGANARRVVRNLGDGLSTVVVEGDTGEFRHPEHGMVWREQRRSEWSVRRGDPLSAEGRETLSAMRRRDGVETVVTARHRLRVSATHWLVEASLTARENGAQVFERSWRREIPRDLM